MKNVIVLEKDGKLEAWGAITAACEAHSEFQYHSIKWKDFPFEHKGYVFHKIPYNERQDG